MPYFLCTDKAKEVIGGARDSFELLFDEDPEFKRLPLASREEIKSFTPRADQAVHDNLEIKLWKLRMDLVNSAFDYKSLVVPLPQEVKSEENLRKWLAEIRDASVNPPRDLKLTPPLSIEVQRLKGTEQSRGTARLTFPTAGLRDLALGILKGALPPDLQEHCKAEMFDMKKGLREVQEVEEQLGKLQVIEDARKEELKRDPSGEQSGLRRVLSNEEALAQLQQYVAYEAMAERRGTMH